MTNIDIDPHSRFDPFLYKGHPIERPKNPFRMPAAIIALAVVFGGIVWGLSGDRDRLSTAASEPSQTTGQGSGTPVPQR
jgi:hypothetical protein